MPDRFTLAALLLACLIAVVSFLSPHGTPDGTETIQPTTQEQP